MCCSFIRAADNSGYFYDKSGEQTIKSIQDLSFIPFEGRINNGLKNGVYWIKMDLENDQQVVEITAPRILEVQCFSNGEEINRRIYALLPTFEIPDNTQSVYLKVVCQKEAYIPIKTYKASEFINANQKRFLAWGLYYGFAIMVVVMNVFYFFSLKEKSFLHYVLFLIIISLGLFHRDGLMPILTASVFLIKDAEVIIHLLIPIAGSLFAANYLQHEIHFPKLKYWVYGLHGIVATFYITYFVTDSFYWFAYGDIIAISILTLYWVSGVLLFNKNTFSKFFTIAYSVILILAFDFFISPLFGIPNIGITTSLLKIGGVFEMLVLSYAVVFRMRELRKENDQIKNDVFNYLSQLSELESELDKLKQGEDNIIASAILNAREIEIITLIAEGKSNKEIAEEIHVSINTVKYHIKKLYDKLDISSRKEALVKATELQKVNI